MTSEGNKSESSTAAWACIICANVCFSSGQDLAGWVWIALVALIRLTESGERWEVKS